MELSSTRSYVIDNTITKQYNLVPCEGFHVNTPVCGSQWHGSSEQGEYCSSGSAAIGSLKTAI